MPQSRKPLQHIGPHTRRILLQPLVAQNLQRGDTGRRGYRIAAKGVEVTKRAAKRRHHIGARQYGGHRIAIAHRLAHRHHIGHHANPVMPPEVCAQPPEPRLHLIGNQQPARRPDHRRRLIQKPGIHAPKPLIGKERAQHHPRKPMPRRFQLANRPGHMRGKRCRLPLPAPAHRAQRIGRRHQPHMRRIAPDWRPAGRKHRCRRGIPVIGIVGRNHPHLARHRLRHAQRNIIRLRSRAHHNGLRNPVAQMPRQPLDVIQHPVMQIPRMGVQRR